jgi:hypothetical protein
MKNIFIILFLHIWQIGFASDVCEINGPTPKSITPINCKKYDGTKGAPFWWTKADPRLDREGFFYSCADSNNMWLNLTTGEQSEVPGYRDAVPSADGLLLSVSGNQRSLNLFPIDAKGRYTTPTVADLKMPHAYQSISVLSENEKDQKKTYRVLIDNNQGAALYKDYTVTYDNNKVPSVSPEQLTKEPKSICTQVEMKPDSNGHKSIRYTQGEGTPLYFKMKLPMLSKNGQLLSAFDPVDQVTRIYKIDPDHPEKCVEEYNLGIPTGKVEFSPDNSKVVFHANSEPGVSDWFENPYPDSQTDAFSLDLKSNKYKRLSSRSRDSRKAGSSYYPSYRADGSVVFLRQKRSDDGNFLNINRTPMDYEAVMISAKDADPTNGEDLFKINPASCINTENKKDFISLIALGALWTNICNEQITLKTESVLLLDASEIKSKDCFKKVKQLWASRNKLTEFLADQYSEERDNTHSLTIKDFDGLTLNDLLAVCPNSRDRINL